MRMLALAERLRADGASVEFVSRPLAGHLCDLIEHAGFTVHRLAGDEPPNSWEHDLDATRRALGSTVDWLVIDHYQLHAPWERAARAFCRRILVVDDLAREHDCDVLLDQNFHQDPGSRYAGRLGPRCERLLGPRYALLIEQFLEARSAIRQRDGEVRRLLVSFGGRDAGGETRKALEALHSLAQRRFPMDVVATSGHAMLDAIDALCRGMHDCALHVDVSDMATLLHASDLAIGAGGSSMWERCSAGLPSIVIAIADNQVPSSKAMAAAGHSIYLGESTSVSAAGVASAVRGLLADPARLRRMSAQCAELVDARGTRRVSARLLADTIALRRATDADCDRIHQWRNAEINRRLSSDAAEISLERHRAWFAERLRDGSCDLLVAERGLLPVGVLRYDIDGGEARISIYLVPGEHGRGLGRQLLVRGNRWLSDERPAVRTVSAEVLEGNTASIKAFADAGYERRGTLLACDIR